MFGENEGGWLLLVKDVRKGRQAKRMLHGRVLAHCVPCISAPAPAGPHCTCLCLLPWKAPHRAGADTAHAWASRCTARCIPALTVQAGPMCMKAQHLISTWLSPHQSAEPSDMLPCRDCITVDRDSWKVERQLGRPGVAKWREDGTLAALTTREQSGACWAGGKTGPVRHLSSARERAGLLGNVPHA